MGPETTASREVARARQTAVPRATSTSPVWREALVFASPEGGAAVGELKLSWRLDADSDPAVTAVTVDPDFGGLGRGATRNDGWHTVAADGPVRLVRGGPSVAVAAGRVPAGVFAHVFVSARGATATGTFGEEKLITHVEPIAHRVAVPADGGVHVEIVLICLQRPGGGARDRAA